MSLSGLLLPAPERAFPNGWHDRLIKAAIHADEAVAFAHADAWLRANDIDHAQLRDHRLLVEVAARFGQRLAGHAAYPRLVGLRRMLWTRSRMAVREADPALRALAAAGVDLLLFNGADRLADGGDQRAQDVVHDLDIAVRPQQMPAAFDTLVAQRWRPAQSVSHHHVREHLASMRGVRMSRGHVGDLHLHAALFEPGHGEPCDDVALWQRSHPGSLGGVAVRVPSPEDRLALAIAHGGLAADDHADWLVDAADLMARNAVDWPGFQAVVETRSLRAPALFALAYLSAEGGLPVPPAVLARIAAAARARPLAYLSAFARARHDDRTTPVEKLIVAASRLLRKRIARRVSRREPDRWLAVRRVTAAGAAGPAVMEQSVPIPPGLGPGRAHLHAIIEIEPPAVRRRIEFELNGAGRHIGRIRYRHWGRGRHPLVLAVDVPIEIRAGDTAFTLEARPGRLLRHGGRPEQKARYDALPFRCVELALTSGEMRGPI